MELVESRRRRIESSNPMNRLLVIVLAAAIVGGVAGAAIGLVLGGDRSTPTASASPALPSESAGNADLSERLPTPGAIYRADAPSVVVITDTQTQVVPPTLFTPSYQQKVGALGSGFVIDHDGDVVTNDHVVQGATGIRVGFSSGVSYPARVVGTDASTDIAVVRVRAPAGALHPLAFSDSRRVDVGDAAYAIGNPFGLDRTMTAGIISATGRDITAPNGFTIPNAIQTDASINHGNSGGPLLDGAGRVMGVNAQIEGGTVNGNVGIGFAVPSDTAESVSQQLISSGHARHAWLGVEIETIDPSIAKVVRGLPTHGVVIVHVVDGCTAAKAGLVAASRRVTVDGQGGFVRGDSIVAMDGVKVTGTAQLGDLLASHAPGDTVTLVVYRSGKTRTVEVTVGNIPS